MEKAGKRVLLVRLLVFVLGVFVGLGAAGFLGGDEGGSARGSVEHVEPSPEDGGRFAADAELVAALVDLRATLADMQRVLLRPASGSPPASEVVRVPADGGGDERVSQELAAAMSSLAAVLRADPGSLRAAAKDDELVIPEWVDRGAAFARYSRLVRGIEEEDAWERADDALRREHLLWTRQRVLDSYGKPERIEHDDGHLMWSYRVEDAEAIDTFHFYFHGGLVADVDFESEERE